MIMDNVSTRMCHDLRHLIEERGVYLLYHSVPYLPDLSPIEYGFNVYKYSLKRNSKDFGPDEFFDLHWKALNQSLEHCNYGAQKMWGTKKQ